MLNVAEVSTASAPAAVVAEAAKILTAVCTAVSIFAASATTAAVAASGVHRKGGSLHRRSQREGAQRMRKNIKAIAL